MVSSILQKLSLNSSHLTFTHVDELGYDKFILGMFESVHISGLVLYSECIPASGQEFPGASESLDPQYNKINSRKEIIMYIVI